VESLLPWALLLAYGAGFYLLAPKARDAAGFYQGRDPAGRSPRTLRLFASVWISWIFAKSVTNAANLGAAYGLPGTVAYGTYWLSIPIAAVVIVWLRSRDGATSLPEWIATRYGKWAAYGLLLAILIRLYNEVWSNTAVVGSYFGASGTLPYYAGAFAFAALTLVYTLKGGLRSSLATDALQAAVFAVFLLAVLAFAVPGAGGDPEVLSAGVWRLAGGVDLLLVALAQTVSYPFHDPVLTDRAFLADRRRTLVAFGAAGVLGFAAIVLFGLVGIPAYLEDMPVDDAAPRVVAATIGGGVLLLVNVVMLTSAGSTLDSTFSSIAKALDPVTRTFAGRLSQASTTIGRWVMVGAAVIGTVPLLLGAEILQATTISGTMVIGLAPVFVLGALVRAPPASFHLAFWPGLAVGVAETLGLVPAVLHVGDGDYASLLGANLYGLAGVTALFLVPVAARAWPGRAVRRPARPAPTGT
jgi:Na+/proline symporter